MARQVGAALGVAILVAVLGSGALSLASLRSGWLISALGGISTAVAFIALGSAERRVVYPSRRRAGRAAGATHRSNRQQSSAPPPHRGPAAEDVQ